jgi:hypothetical protein
MSATDELVGAFETHDPAGIRAALAAGASATASIGGKPPLKLLVEMYTRSPKFGECLAVLLDAGAAFEDPLLEAILLDDPRRLGRLVEASPELLERRFELECAFTPLRGVSPLHLCAEYNCVRAAGVLLGAGLPVDVRAGTDPHGLGGHTPLFHTVNSNRNFARPMMELLVESGANLDVHLKGLVWGLGFEWETTILDLTPLSYAQCGLYFQFHRREEYIYDNLRYLYERKYGRFLPIRNVPNRYLQGEPVFPPRM